MKAYITVGIDPDVEKNGVAILRSDEGMQLKNLPFPSLIEFLKMLNEEVKQKNKDIIVLIEAGWLNRSNWHLSPRMTAQKAAQIGNATGRNHETGRKIVECCDFYNIPYKLIKPLRKVWSGTDGKISAEEFSKITGYNNRTNQEERDAGLIAWFYK